MFIKTRSGLLLAALSVSVGAQAQDYLPILQYHHVSESTPKSTSVTPAQFTEHMDYLKNAGFKVVDLKTALDDLKANKALPEKAVAITFDDSYLSIYEAGFPILKERGFPFTVFINTDPIGRSSRHFLTWDQIIEMQKSNGVFANHSINHPYMTRKEEGETQDAWLLRMAEEVDTVERLLKEKLGVSPKMFAYPYGESNKTVRSLIRERGMVAFGQQSGVVSAGSNFDNLPRFPAAGPYANLSTLKTKLNAKPMPLLSEETGGDFASDQAVTLGLTFKEGNYRLKDLVCYVSGQGKAKLDWQSDTKMVASAEQPFNVGRGRINCTMPDATGQSYYWYSNVWIRAGADQNYVDMH